MLPFFKIIHKNLSLLPKGLFLFLVIGLLSSSSIAIILGNQYLSGYISNSRVASAPPHFQLAAVVPIADSNPTPITQEPTGKVLGSNNYINFVSQQGQSMNEGVIVLSSGIDPAVSVSAYNSSPEIEFNLYKINQQDLLSYLLYKEEEVDGGYYSNLKKIYRFDTSQLELVNSFSQQINGSNQGDKTKLNLPLDETGLWYLEGKYSGQKISTVLVRSKLAGLANKTDNGITFWVQDKDKKLVNDAQIEIFNTQNNLTSLGKIKTNNQGIAEIEASQVADIAVVSHGSSMTLVPLNLTGFISRSSNNPFYTSFGPRQVETRSFVFTDRVLYKPGDKIYFKAIIRDDDDARYTLPSGQVRVTLSGGQDKKLYEAELLIDDLGTVDGEINLSEDVEVGYYNLTIYDGDKYLSGSYLQIAEFHKPDSEVSLLLSDHTYFPGDKLQARIHGSYFLGQPLSGQTVNYKVYTNSTNLSGNYEDISFNSTLSYYAGNQDLIFQGSVELDKNGQADLDLDVVNESGHRQFWDIVLEYVDAGGAATNDGATVLVNPGDFVIEKNYEDNPDTPIVNKLTSVPLVAQPTKANVDVSKIKASAQLFYHDDQQQKIAVGEPQQLVAADGRFTFEFTPTEVRTYLLELESYDKHKNFIKGEVNLYVQDHESINNYQPGETIKLTTDKDSYDPGETATVTIDPSFDSQDLFAYWGRTYSKDYRILSNGAKQFSFLIPEDYQPNFYLNVGSFVNDRWVSSNKNIKVNTADKKLNLNYSFDQNTYGPAQTAVVDVVVKDDLGNPVKTDLAVWVFDKALLELNKDSYGKIFDKFWRERFSSPLLNHSFLGLTSSGAEGGGGCFAAETQILMADDSTKEISQVKTGDWIKTFKSRGGQELIATQVTNTHQVNVDGYLIINEDFKLTPEHKLLVNNEWQTASQIKIGDKLMTASGDKKTVSSIEWVRGKFTVYNLTTAKYHTFIADNIYVHNDKGDSRTIFKDTAYWNPHLMTDDDGRARVSIQLPDNLTTWVIAGVAANQKTQVGSGEDEFIVTKEVVVRPVTPTFLRQGDSLFLSALVNNFTDKNLKFDVTADLDIAPLEDPARELAVDAQDLAELSWATRIDSQDGPATFQVRAQATGGENYVDEVTLKIPVFEYGFWQDSYVLGENQQAYDLPVTAGADQSRSETSLFLQSNRYPEFKSAWENILLAQGGYFSNIPSILSMAAVGDIYGQKLDLPSNTAQNHEIVSGNLKTLNDSMLHQSYDWDDYSRVNSQLETIEALTFIQQAGYEVNQQLIDRLVSYFSNWNPEDYEEQAVQQYALSFVSGFNSSRKKLPVTTDFGDAKPAILAILANYQNEFETNKEKVIEQILGIKFENDYQLSWSNNSQHDFNDSYEASLLATSALIKLGADQQIIEKGLDYLYRNRGQQASYKLVKVLANYFSTYAPPKQQLSYQVSLNGQAQDAGSMVSGETQVKELKLQKTETGVDQLQIDHGGQANLYSKLKTTEFITDKEIASAQTAFEISREYLAANNEDDPVDVGDLVIIEFKIINLGSGERDLEIVDYLPSGLVAIDQSLDNGVFDKVETDPIGQQKISGQTATLKINTTDQDVATIRYKARVVSQGIFDTPPAIIRHTGEPSLWARSDSTRLVLDGKNKLKMMSTSSEMPEMKTATDIPWGWISLGMIVIIAMIRYGVWLKSDQQDETSLE